MSIEATASSSPITATATSTSVQAAVGTSVVSSSSSGGVGPQGPQGPQGEPGQSGASDWADIANKPSTFAPEAHAASHGAAGADVVTIAASQLTGGSLPTGAALDFSDGTKDSEVGGWGFGVELTADTSQFATVQPSGFVVSGGAASVVVSGITDANDGFIAPVSGWGDASGTKWSDLNGTYVRTSVAVTPPAYTDGHQGMHTPASGTYNYYLSNPSSLGSTTSGLNGIAYFLAPGNRSGWGDPNNDGQTDTPVNYWRLVVLCDWPFTYFTNPSSDPTTFPIAGWVPVSASAPNGNEGAGYNGADYLGAYGGGFSVAASGGSANLSSESLAFDNGAKLQKGTLDAGVGGSRGIALRCSADYELKWEGGRLFVMEQNGATIRRVEHCRSTAPTANNDSSDGFVVDSLWILDDGTTYLCEDATVGAAVWTEQMIPVAWNDVTGKPTFFSGAYADLSGTPSLATVATSGSYADLSNKPSIPSAYTLPTASSSVLGGVKVGGGLSIDGSSILSATYSYTLPAATGSTLGGVIVGTGLGVSSGTVSVSYGSSSTTACAGNDSRLSDARTPTAHNQAWSTITSTPTTLSGYGITDAVGSSDSRLTNSRTPTAHTHGLADLTQSGATSGQIASWSGTAWVPVTPSSASVADGSITTLKLASDIVVDCGSYSAVAPNAPTGLTATAGVVGAANLSWTAPTLPGGAAITDYSIQYSTDSGSSWTSWSHSASTATTATVTGLSGVATVFRVAGINSVGTGSYSSSSSAITPASSIISISRNNGTSTFAGSGTAASPYARATKIARNNTDGLDRYSWTASSSGTFYYSLWYDDVTLNSSSYYIKVGGTTRVTGGTGGGNTGPYTGSFAVTAGNVITITSDYTTDAFSNLSFYAS